MLVTQRGDGTAVLSEEPTLAEAMPSSQETAEAAEVAQVNDPQPDEEAQVENSSGVAGSVEESAEESAEDAGKRKTRKTAADRIHGLLDRNRALQAQYNADIARERSERQALENRLRALEAGAQVGAVSTGAPDPAKFEFGELDPKYIDALVQFRASSLIEDRMTKAEAARAQREAARVQNDNAQKAQQRAIEVELAGQEKYADFSDKVVPAAQAWGAQAAPMAAVLLQSPAAHDIFYYLAEHPAEVDAIIKLDPMGQAASAGRLAARFEGAINRGKPPQIGAPPRFVARGAGGFNNIGAATTSFADFEKQFKGK